MDDGRVAREGRMDEGRMETPLLAGADSGPPARRSVSPTSCAATWLPYEAEIRAVFHRLPEQGATCDGVVSGGTGPGRGDPGPVTRCGPLGTCGGSVRWFSYSTRVVGGGNAERLRPRQPVPSALQRRPVRCATTTSLEPPRSRSAKSVSAPTCVTEVTGCAESDVRVN